MVSEPWGNGVPYYGCTSYVHDQLYTGKALNCYLDKLPCCRVASQQKSLLNLVTLNRLLGETNKLYK